MQDENTSFWPEQVPVSSPELVNGRGSILRMEPQPASPKAAHAHELNIIYKASSADPASLAKDATEAAIALLKQHGLEAEPTVSYTRNTPRLKVTTEIGSYQFRQKMRDVNHALGDPAICF